MRILSQSIVTLVAFCLLSVAQANEEFPGRDSFPLIPYIELNDLYENFDDYTIIDARSEYEFDTLRIKGAYNVPLSSRDFETRVKELVATHGKPIAFYCNGKTCFKSYEATLKAQRNGVENSVAFDAGIFDWVTAHPDLGELLGESPVDVKALIGSAAFKARQLGPTEFADKAGEDNAIVLDVRDAYQREGIGFFPDVEHTAPLDQSEKLNEYIQLAKTEGRPLLIYDEAGKQVRWLQYRIERAGVKDYYFMAGGAKAFYNALILSSGYRYKPSN